MTCVVENAMMEQEESTLCNLKLPKFEVEFHKELNDSLKQMGLEIAFMDGLADFSGIGVPDDADNMYIEKVQQKSKIIVDEEGTEAAAVTTVGIVMTSMPAQPQKVVFNANKPFVYVIQENSTGSILFMGIVKNFN